MESHNSKNSFEDFPLKEELMRGIYSYGFETPSKIQYLSIPHMIKKKDIIAQGQSGTGKTGAFVIGMLHNIDAKSDNLQAIIISPTRELAIQTKKVTEHIGEHMEARICLCIGGTNVGENKKEVINSQIVVGTPGRLLELITQGYLITKYIVILIIDEADELLSKDFTDQMRGIISEIPKSTQICIFSATYTPSVIALSKEILNDPSHILIDNNTDLTLEGIRQYKINGIKEHDKFDTLMDLFGMLMINQILIYVNSKERADMLKDLLKNKKYSTAIIHSGMNITERSDVLESFRQGRCRYLITTNLLARGIDIQTLSAVINYDFPRDKETYIHRIGRSGRFGRKGLAINFITERDVEMLKTVEQFYETMINDLPNNFKNLY